MIRRRRVYWPILLTAILLALPLSVTARADDSATYKGRAFSFYANIAGQQRVTLSDTGELPSSGGALEESAADEDAFGLGRVRLLHAAVIGSGQQTSAQASVANLSIGTPQITADFVLAEANAQCTTTLGSSEIAGFRIGGERVRVTQEPNQTITIPGGRVVINEHITNGNFTTVNALHITVGTVTDIVIASASAGVTCLSPPPGPVLCPLVPVDFVTGGGWIPTAAKKANFSLAAGMENGTLSGHLNYHDKSGLKLTEATITGYGAIDSTTRRVDGTALANGQPVSYVVLVSDRGEPGRSDTFSITLSNGYRASGTLGGGNIQLHDAAKVCD